MSKRSATNLITKPTMTQQKLSLCALIHQFSACCCLSDTDNKILFRIKWQWVNQVSHVAFLRCRKPSNCLWSTWNTGNLPQHVWVSTVTCTAFGTPGESVLSKDELRTSQMCAVKSTSTRSIKPGRNSPTSHWCMMQRMETAGKRRGFITSYFWSQCFCRPLPIGSLYICSG